MTTKQVMLLAPSEAARDVVSSEFSGSATVFGVTATAFATYNNGAEYWGLADVDETDEVSLLGALTSGWVTRASVLSTDDFQEEWVAILEKLRAPTVADNWVIPDFTGASVVDAGTFFVSHTVTATGGIVTVDTDVSGAGQSPFSSRLNQYAYQVIDIADPSITGSAVLYIDMDWVATAASLGTTVAIAVMPDADPAVSAGEIQFSGWHDASGGYFLKASGLTSSHSEDITALAWTNGARLRQIMTFDGTQSKCVTTDVVYYGSSDDSFNSEKVDSGTSEAFDLASGCHLALVFGTYNPVSSGDIAIPYNIRYQWVDTSGGPA